MRENGFTCLRPLTLDARVALLQLYPEIPTQITPGAPNEFDDAVRRNPALAIVVTPHGGHCAFVEHPRDGYDGYWADREIVRFVTGYL